MDEELSVEQAYAIAGKVVEMAERVKIAHRVAPGASACWGFELDGQGFDIVMRVREQGR